MLSHMCHFHVHAFEHLNMFIPQAWLLHALSLFPCSLAIAMALFLKPRDALRSVVKPLDALRSVVKLLDATRSAVDPSDHAKQTLDASRSVKPLDASRSVNMFLCFACFAFCCCCMLWFSVFVFFWACCLNASNNQCF